MVILFYDLVQSLTNHLILSMVWKVQVNPVPNSNSATSSTFSHGGTKTITCNGGYSYEQQITFTLTCSDSTVGGTVPDQCYMDCNPPLNAPDNGKITGGNLHGESVQFSCDRGYGINGTETDTCDNGVWENGGTPPTCYELSLTDSITLYCNPDKFIVEIPGALLGSDVSENSVSLGSCSGSYYDGVYLYANSSYTDCDTTAEVDEQTREIIYKNTVRSASSTDPITTQESLNININCVFDQDNIVSSSAVVQNSLTEDLTEDGQYQMVFAAYTDRSYNNEITGDVRVNTNDVIYLRAEVEYVSRIDVFPSRCYATPEPEADHFRYEDLIDEGCPALNLVSNLSTAESTNQNFGFWMRVFRFTDSNSDSIYIHCELKICPIDQYECPLPSSCTSVRRKRSTQINFSRHVSAGPIRISHHDTTADESSSGAWQFTALTVYSATVSCMLLIAVLTIIGVITYRKRNSGYRRTGQI
ncbi:putative complement factor H [Apostichopus japonicus]|uniref:Putative complement factor H n=1 Tax=Stichopus japonicus TaxID=307972 RepID=A0A2G8LN03_STIJA|nr:putative complement factor H [Apostichopus japonicus]